MPALSDDKPESLFQQRETARFNRGLAIAESIATHRALLTTAELARINAILVGREPKDTDPEPYDPWRQEPVTLTLPSGRVETLSVIADPKLLTREKLHRATETAEAGGPIDAAVDIYVGLVAAHAFRDANRRTAVCAAHYFLNRYGVPLSGLALHEIGLGDVRVEADVQALRETVQQMAKFVAKQKRT
jgi:prophage maintenance system killer protein